MIAHGLDRIHGNIHRAHDGAGAVSFAGGFSAFDLEDTENVGDAEYCTVWTGIFAPWAFNEERKYERGAEDDQAADGDFGAPEVEEGEVRVVFGEDERSAGGGNVHHPG